MEVKKGVVEKVKITCKDHEYEEAVDFCSNGGYTIVDTYAVKDGRSLRYMGESVIIAEKSA